MFILAWKPWGLWLLLVESWRKVGSASIPVSGFFHDHCFVPLGNEDEAIEALAELSRESGGK